MAFWPKGVLRSVAVAAFEDAFRTLGYARSADGALKDGYEKVAIYVDPVGKPTHMARQLGDGRWTSKLGDQQDIEHGTPQGVEGAKYGTASIYLERQCK